MALTSGVVGFVFPTVIPAALCVRAAVGVPNVAAGFPVDLVVRNPKDRKKSARSLARFKPDEELDVVSLIFGSSFVLPSGAFNFVSVFMRNNVIAVTLKVVKRYGPITSAVLRHI